MKLFVDTANVEEIERALDGGFVCGVTTNPSLLAREPKGEYLAHMARIVAVLRSHGAGFPLSVEVFATEPVAMVRQATEFVKVLAYENVAVKVHVSHGGRDYLAVVRELSARGIAVNCTACVTPLQAAMAAASGARYVSLFYNRIRDGNDAKWSERREAMLRAGDVEEGDFDPDRVVSETRALLSDVPAAEIIAGSIRTVVDVKRAALAGAHIVTVPPKFFAPALAHYKTDEAVDQFLGDFARWMA